MSIPNLENLFSYKVTGIIEDSSDNGNINVLDGADTGRLAEIGCQIGRQGGSVRGGYAGGLLHLQDAAAFSGVLPPVPGKKVQPIVGQAGDSFRAGEQIR